MTVRAFGTGARDPAAARPAPSRRRTRWSPPALPSAPASPPRMRSARWQSSPAPPAASISSAPRRTARSSSSITPTSPTRSPPCCASLRPMTRGLLYVVFGAGGDRDAGKRPLMGKAAAENADVVIVTDDNPRSEDAGRDPQGDPRRRARRHRDCRPRRGHPPRRRACSAPATCSASPARATRPARSSASQAFRFPITTRSAPRSRREEAA